MDALTIELISNIGEIIAAAAIIVSLIYVGFQVRQNTQTIRIATAQGQMEGISNITNHFVQSPTLAAIWAGRRFDPAG